MLKYIFIFLISITITSCRVKNCETLTPQDLEWVPYMFQNQEITFINTEDTTDTLLFEVKISPITQSTLNYDYWNQSDNECGETIAIEYYCDSARNVFFSIYRAYNQMGINTSGSGGIAGRNDYKNIGLNASIIYDNYSTLYHTFNKVYKYLDNQDTIWYAKNFGIIKLYKYDLEKLLELKF